MSVHTAYLTPVNPAHQKFLTMLQLTLENYYDIDPPYSISEFVCHSAQTDTGSLNCKGTTPEMLVYREDGTNLDISLFLNPSLLTDICTETYKQSWTGNLFDNGCIVLEGASHFLYMVFNAHYDRQVSMLDLELQAEIDKFLFAVLDTRYSDAPDKLLHRLFCEVSYREDLSDALRHRYQQANDLAHSYCQWLHDTYELKSNNKSLLTEVGKIYRLNGTAKQEHIHRVTAAVRLAG